MDYQCDHTTTSYHFGRLHSWLFVAVLAGGMQFAAKSHAVNYYPDSVVSTINGVTNDLTSIGDGGVGIGLVGSNTRLNIINGGFLRNREAYVGRHASSHGNKVSISGLGSSWSSGSMVLGETGSVNTVVVTNQGSLVVNGSLTLGENASSSSNLIHVTGSGSSFRTANAFFLLGDKGSYNTIRVDNGGSMTNGPNTSGTRLGGTAGSHHNAIELSDSGTYWRDFEPMYVGNDGDYNSLVISNSAVLATFEPASLGENAGSDYNHAVINGAGSLWEFQTDSSLIIGNKGAGNSMTIANGGAVKSKLYIYDLALIIGQDVTSDSNTVIVTGSGSTFSNYADTIVGNLGSDNAMHISSGGRVINQTGWIGQQAGDNHVTVDGVGSEWINMEELEVGFIGGDCSLLISNGGYVVSTGLFWAAYIGNQASSDGNSVTVEGIGSVWEGQGWFEVGKNGANNTLAVNDGGRVEAYKITLGVNAGATNNILSINGGIVETPVLIIQNKGRIEGVGKIIGGTTLSSGSVLSPGFSTGVITNNGNVRFNSSSVYEAEINGTAPGADHDVLVVNGSVTISNAILDVTLGYMPAFSTEFTIIQNDGSDAVSGQFIGMPEGASVATNGAIALSISYKGGTGNDVVLTAVPAGPIYWSGGFGDYHTAGSWKPAFVPRSFDDANFTNSGTVNWTNNAAAARALFNMTQGPSSVVTLNIGSYNWNLTESVIVGQHPGVDARMCLNNGTISATNGSGDAIFEVRYGDLFIFGGTIAADQLVVTNSGGDFNFFNGQLVTRSGRIDSGYGMRVGTSGTGASWKVWGNNATTLIAGAVAVGSAGSQATLVITNGAKLEVTGTSFSYLGDRASSPNNRVLISGPGSRWENEYHLWNESAGNVLEINRGGSLRVGKDINFGRDGSTHASISNLIMVTGSGSSLTISNYLTLGYDSPQNQLVVSDGGIVSNVISVIGSQSESSGNHVTVTGAGSVWMMNQQLTIGSSPEGNSLLVSAGGRVQNETGVIGGFSSSSNNAVTVTGSGSVWSNGYDTSVGQQGSDNSLMISSGGHVISANRGLVGSFSGANRNHAVIDGAGSRWTALSEINVGSSGSYNTFVITNGGKAVNRSGSVGENSSAGYNVAIVTGSNSEWVNSNSLKVGSSGSFNTLRIEAGGRAVNTFFSFGGSSSTSNNLVVIDGPQSLLGNYGDAYVGSGGKFNTMIVTNGGMMVVSNYMYLGYSGTDNTLVVADGGHVDMNGGSVGSFVAGSFYNTLRLDGGSISVSNNISVKTNNTITGSGTVTGWLRIENGGKLAPGNSFGTIVLSENPSLSGEVIMELGKQGGVLTNDQVIITDAIVYNGVLTVNHLGPDALAPGDSFKLFDATGYFGSFDDINLPALSGALSWTNNLLVDGTIMVAGDPVEVVIDNIALSGGTFVFDVTGGTPSSGWELLAATNLLPPNLWITNMSGVFDLSGNAVITNSIDPAYRERYYRLGPP